MNSHYSFSRQGNARSNRWHVAIDGVLAWVTVEKVTGGWVARGFEAHTSGQAAGGDTRESAAANYFASYA
jgi:hypothetical protein